MPGLLLLLSEICGIFAALSVYFHSTLLFLFFLFLAVFLISFLDKVILKTLAAIIFIVAILVSFAQVKPFYEPDVPDSLCMKKISITATVSDFSKQTSRPNTFRISHITINGKEYSGFGKVYALSDPPLSYSRVNIYGESKKIPTEGFINKLNKNEYIIYADDVKIVKSYAFFRFFSKMRKRIEENTYLSMKSSEAMLFLSSICGISSLSYDEKKPFIGTGTAHIFAVSGLHVGILGESIDKITTPFGSGYQSFSILLVLLFVFLVGFRVSAIRAFLMYGISALSTAVGREQIPINTLSLIALAILLLSPLALFTVSFQMSFAAILGLLVIAPIIYSFFPKHFLFRMLSEVVSVQLILFPIIAFYFHSLFVISFIANLIVIPLMYILMPIGILQLLFSLCGLHCALFFAPITNFSFRILNKIVFLFYNLPYAKLNVSFNIYFLLAYFSFLAIFIFAFKTNKRWKYITIVALLGIVALPFILKPALGIYPISLEGEDGFLILKRQTAVYVSSPTGLKSEKADLYSIGKVLSEHGVNKIDLMIFDAPFADKESSSVYLIDDFKVEHVVIPSSDSDLESAFVRLNRNKTDIRVANLNSTIILKGMKFGFVSCGKKYAVLLEVNGRKYLLVGKGVSSIPAVNYDVLYTLND